MGRGGETRGRGRLPRKWPGQRKPAAGRAQARDALSAGRTGLAARQLHNGGQDKQSEDRMNAVKVIAIVLILAGALGLVYQQFSFTRQTTQAKLGPLELSVKEKETVNIPLWVSLGAIGVGVLLLVTGRKK